LSERKARAVAARHAGEDALVIAADTIVAVGEGVRAELLGKPSDRADAQRMLERLSSSRHRVVTGVTVVHARNGAARSGYERTWVTMRAIEPLEIAAYLASGEWRDKAGGYAIQESADRFVTHLEEAGSTTSSACPLR
jgi:septum formation protein